MTLGESIVSLRARKGWSQGDLADMLDVSRQSVSKWETDSSVPELDKLLKLADLFGVTLDALVRGEEVPDKTAQETPQAAPVDFSAQPLSTASRRHTTAGMIFLCTGAALFLLTLLLSGSAAGIVFAVPFLLCGVICLAAQRRAGLWCTWAVYLCADFYLRYATGLSWSTILLTTHWTPEMNYMRLLVAWGQFLAILVLLGATLFSYRRLALEGTKKRLAWLALGWLAVLALMPYLLSLCQQLLIPPQSGYRYSLYYYLTAAYSYLRLALIALLSVRTLAVLRAWRAERRAQQEK